MRVIPLQDYGKNKQIDATISYVFPVPAPFEPFEVEGLENNARVVFKSNCLIISIKRQISAPLVKGIKKRDQLRATQAKTILLGFLSDIIGPLNDRLSILRYNKGHLLLKSISSMDLLYVSINRKWRRPVIFPHNSCIGNFKPLQKHSKAGNEVFVRDLIDAMRSYLYHDYDECIRKLITSVENFYDHLGLSGTFKSKLQKIIQDKYYLKRWDEYLPIFRSNLSFIYALRNSIVHNKLRLTSSDSSIVKRGIGTLFYVYQNSQLESHIFDYTYHLGIQFQVVNNHTCGHIPDSMMKDSKHDEKAKYITYENLEADLDKFNFNGLAIDEIEKDEYR